MRDRIPSGVQVYFGRSRFTGGRIRAILTGLSRPSDNPKTGPVIQSWILPATGRPNMQSSICGTCSHRGRSCYVSWGRAPAAIAKARSRGVYPRVSLAEAARIIKASGRPLRVGSAGDPGAMPARVWRTLSRAAGKWTGYTHAWRTAPGLKATCMASVDAPAEAAQAQARGWRTFRVRSPGAPLMPGEIDCPASAESGHRTTCDRCTLCMGAAKRAANISITAHGTRAGSFVESEV